LLFHKEKSADENNAIDEKLDEIETANENNNITNA